MVNKPWMQVFDFKTAVDFEHRILVNTNISFPTITGQASNRLYKAKVLFKCMPQAVVSLNGKSSYVLLEILSKSRA